MREHVATSSCEQIDFLQTGQFMAIELGFACTDMALNTTEFLQLFECVGIQFL